MVLGLHQFYQDGKSVFKYAVTSMAGVAAEIMERNNLKGDDIAYLVPHHRLVLQEIGERAVVELSDGKRFLPTASKRINLI